MPIRLLDTNIVSFVVKAHPILPRYRPHLAGYDLAISFQTFAELTAWGQLSNWGPARWARLRATLSTLVVIHSDEALCERWAFVKVARRTQPIAVGDAWIAATALANRLELVTHNPADFRSIPGLVVISEAP